MIDLRRAITFMEQFKIRSRATNRPIPFRLNNAQRKVMQDFIDHTDKGHRLYAIFCKARRMGITKIIRTLTQCAILEKKYSEAIIMAQLKRVAQSIFDESKELAKQLPLKPGGMTETANVLEFPRLQSSLTWNTANSVKGERGLAYTHLHATEAAYYEDAEVFTAVLNCLSDDPENMAFIETTANGTEGPGAAYHELWQASVRGENEFLPIFLPWWDDPEYIRPAHLAKDAPRDEYEKYLMRDLKLSRERVAFFRYALANKCQGKLDKWRKEYPGTAEEAFEATGVPVFDFDDSTHTRKVQKVPVDICEIKISRGRNSLRAHAERHTNARYVLYEKPQPGCHYFMGVVVGAGNEDEDDSLAAVVWNGENGSLAARFQDTLHPATASEQMTALGIYFNRAMVCVHDGNGGFGTQIIQEMRDRWRYPNPYRWKGRNDRLSADAAAKSIGFSITDYTRKMILNNFVADIKRLTVIPCDDMFMEQMPSAQWEGFYPYEAFSGEDDVLWAGLLGWIARTQHHPRKCDSYAALQPDGGEDEDVSRLIPHKRSPFNTDLIRHGRIVGAGVHGGTLQHHLDERDRKEREIRMGA